MDQQLDFSKYEKMIKDTLASLEQTQQDCKEAREENRKAFEGANNTIKDYKNFKVQYDEFFSKIVDNIGKSSHFNKLSNQDKYGKNKTLQKVSELQLNLEDIQQYVIITGAGVSLLSGISTYRGKDSINGYTSKDGQFFPNEEIGTVEFMQKNEKIFWEDYQEFYNLIKSKKQNKNHIYIDKFLQNDKSGKVTLVTQNIDNLHCQQYEQLTNKMNPKENIFQIHGNVNYGRCGEDVPCNQENKIFKFQKDQIFPTNCKFCGGKARPNVLYFDEAYNEENYFIHSLSERLNIQNEKLPQKSQCLLVLGTTLETQMANKIVSDFLDRNQIIIEVNPEINVIQSGLNTYYFKEKCENIIQDLLEYLK